MKLIIKLGLNKRIVDIKKNLNLKCWGFYLLNILNIKIILLYLSNNFKTVCYEYNRTK